MLSFMSRVYFYPFCFLFFLFPLMSLLFYNLLHPSPTFLFFLPHSSLSALLLFSSSSHKLYHLLPASILNALSIIISLDFSNQLFHA
ncbi:hypothetical protein VNO78_14146 [Psophocarpus tetragonolobus]|uniref:Uncharacterized protein n=1 Tax=Psophocarpus tetragonolobus TaxID=3891 RepID=A0AAN9SSU6_PSOTE